MPRAHHLAIPLLLLALAALLGACGDDKPNTEPAPEADQGVADMRAPDMSADMPLAATGLDARPVNTTCRAFARPSSALSVRLEPAFDDLNPQQTIGMVRAPGDANHWYLWQKDGLLIRFADDAADRQVQTALDLRGQLLTASELGLLGVAFPADFATSRRVYLSYTPGSPRRSRISRMTARADGTLDPATEVVVLEVEQPYNNHNGGTIAFGPDGLLYIALGDGGSAGDPLNSGQDTSTLLGAILRIDPRADASPYTIPPDNPFADGQGGRPELYAWGLRNPWKMSFDLRTGELWAGDVGQGAVEEIDRIERGGNYGWKIREGDRCYNMHPECLSRMDLIEPIATYTHDQGKSVTGGYVLHDPSLPELQGRYIYGDYVSGRVWALGYDPITGAPTPEVMFESAGVAIGAFAQDSGTGEVYVLGFDTRDTPGSQILKLVRDNTPPQTDGPPALLSETGCVRPDDPTQPAEGLIPYAPIAPFWSDGARKQRWLALPEGQRLDVQGGGRLSAPRGSVLVKAFTDPDTGALIETRLMVHHDDGVWAGYTYAWRADQSDAELLSAGEVRQLSASRQWRYPSRGDCLGCHTEAAGRTLGLSVPQLAAPITYPSTGRTADQLDTLAHIGALTTQPTRDAALVDPFGDAPLPQRARAYLHTNCASCHLPGGPARGELDLRFNTPLTQTGACDLPPQLDDLGIPDARLIAPGAPDRSVLLERLTRTDAARMPQLGGFLVDAQGVALLRAWVEGLACP